MPCCGKRSAIRSRIAPLRRPIRLRHRRPVRLRGHLQRSAEPGADRLPRGVRQLRREIAVEVGHQSARIGHVGTLPRRRRRPPASVLAEANRTRCYIAVLAARPPDGGAAASFRRPVEPHPTPTAAPPPPSASGRFPPHVRFQRQPGRQNQRRHHRCRQLRLLLGAGRPPLPRQRRGRRHPRHHAPGAGAATASPTSTSSPPSTSMPTKSAKTSRSHLRRAQQHLPLHRCPLPGRPRSNAA